MRTDVRPSDRAHYDVVVVGAGAIGGWTALNLIRMGQRVALVDAWGPGNSRSSSGGESRVIRCMYGGDSVYLDFVLRAFEIWYNFEKERRVELLRKTGALWMCSGSADYVTASLAHLEQHGLPVDELSLQHAARRYPQIAFDGVKTVFVEHEAGLIRARLSCGEVVRAFRQLGGDVMARHVKPPRIEQGAIDHVTFENGEQLFADQFVFCGGPWLGHLFPNLLGEIITVTRQDVFYLGVPAGDASFSPDHLPVWIDLDERILYGVPDTGERGFKIGDDTRGDRFDPTTDERLPAPESLSAVKRYVARRFPRLRDAPLLETRVCQYANSPDGHFVIDRVPGVGNVWIAGGGSGHAFKLGPSLGEYLADKVSNGGDVHPVFSLRRFGNTEDRRTQWGR